MYIDVQGSGYVCVDILMCIFVRVHAYAACVWVYVGVCVCMRMCVHDCIYTPTHLPSPSINPNSLSSLPPSPAHTHPPPRDNLTNTPPPPHT